MENIAILSHFRSLSPRALNTPACIVCSIKLWGTLASLYVTFALRPRTGDRYARKIPASERNYVIGEKRSYLRCSYRE